MKISIKYVNGRRTEIRKVFPSCMWISGAGIAFTDSEIEFMIQSYKCDGAIIKKNKRSITIDATNV